MRLVPSLAGLLRARSIRSIAAPVARRRRSARRAIMAFVAVFLVASVVFSVGMDRSFPSVRDPEYGKRANRYAARHRENPARPVVAFLGSSRVAMGVKPDLVHADDGPLAFNFGQVGAGPILELMTFRRMLHDGLVPDEIVIEYWFPYLKQDGFYSEEARTDLHRLFPSDKPFLRDWFFHHEHFIKEMDRIRWNPFYEHRLRILSQVVPSWLVFGRRLDAGWEKLDPRGWLPGYYRDLTPTERVERHRLAMGYFGPLFANFSIDEKAMRAMKETVALARSRGIRVTAIWLPESSEFQKAYPPEHLRRGEAIIEAFAREEKIDYIDARNWVPDVHLGDGFHLTIPGAEAFSRKLGDYFRSRP